MIKFNNGEYSGEEFNGLPNGSGVLHHNDLETKYNFVNGLF